jgi:hypothetical protein
LSPFSSACDYKPVQYYATGGALQTETFRQQLFTDEQPAALFQNKSACSLYANWSVDSIKVAVRMRFAACGRLHFML